MLLDCGLPNLPTGQAGLRGNDGNANHLSPLFGRGILYGIIFL